MSNYYSGKDGSIYWRDRQVNQYQLISKVKNWNLNVDREPLETTNVGEINRTWRLGKRGAEGSFTALWYNNPNPAELSATHLMDLILDDGVIDPIKLELKLNSTTGFKVFARVKQVGVAMSVGDISQCPVEFVVSGAIESFSPAIVIPSNYATLITAKNPLLYWRLGDTSGAIATDSSTNSNRGAYNGAYTLGEPNSLSGGSDLSVSLQSGGYITNENNINPGSTATLIFRCKTSVTTEQGLIIFADSFNNPSSYTCGLKLNADGSLTFYLFDGSVRNLTGGTGINNNNWHSIACVYEPGSMRILVDGALVSSLAISTPQSFSGKFYLGTTFPRVNFAGGLDEFAVLPSALTDTEIATIHAAA